MGNDGVCLGVLRLGGVGLSRRGKGVKFLFSLESLSPSLFLMFWGGLCLGIDG